MRDARANTHTHTDTLISTHYLESFNNTNKWQECVIFRRLTVSHQSQTALQYINLLFAESRLVGLSGRQQNQQRNNKNVRIAGAQETTINYKGKNRRSRKVAILKMHFCGFLFFSITFFSKSRIKCLESAP